ncbi:vesicle-associated membrane protein 711 [Tanacetum coccineum]
MISHIATISSSGLLTVFLECGVFVWASRRRAIELATTKDSAVLYFHLKSSEMLVLCQQMDYYSNDPNADRMNRLKGEMSQVRNVMIQNIDKVLERGDRLESLVEKTANMQTNTLRFKKQSRRFRNTMWVILGFALLGILYVVLAFACQGFSLPSCF